MNKMTRIYVRVRGKRMCRVTIKKDYECVYGRIKNRDRAPLDWNGLLKIYSNKNYQNIKY